MHDSNILCYLLQENTAGPSESEKNARDNSEIADIAKSLKVTCCCFVLYYTNGFIGNLFRSIGNFQLTWPLIILNFVIYLQKKAKEFRKNDAQESVKAESYLASNDELQQKKKKKSTKSK